MKLAFLSDMHLGFSKTGRESEAFQQACNALKQALAEKPDAIILAGDLFNEAIPSQEHWLEAFQLLSLPKTHPASEIKISKKETQIPFTGTPVISIHGTHEFRGKDFKNALQVLDAAGFLIYLHGEQALLEKTSEKIAVHGLGGVPEKKALDVLQKFNPKPTQNAYNILLLHQSFKEFLPFDDEMVASLNLTDLPEGFDLFVNGHLHWSNELKEQNKHLLVTGSTVITQMKRLEAEKKKGFFLLNTESKEITFKEISPQRTFHYKKFSFEQANPEKIKQEISTYLNSLNLEKNEMGLSLIKLKLTGSLAPGLSSSDLKEEELLEEFSDKALIFLSKSFAKEDFKLKIKELSDLQKSKQSIISLGLDMLEKNLEKTSFQNAFDIERIFSLLEEGENEKAIELLLKEKQ